MVTYIRLTDCKDSNRKEKSFFKKENRYVINRDIFQSLIQSIQL
jgi:hypothetical protein